MHTAPAGRRPELGVEAKTRCDITHTFDGDLDIFLVSPAGGTDVELTTDKGGSGDNYTQTIFDDLTPIGISRNR